MVMLAASVGFALVYRSSEKGGQYALIPPLIPGVAGVAYAAMAASSAGVVGTDLVVEARYVDWLLTTPLIAYYLTLVADAPMETRATAVAADVAMVVVGYVATVTAGLLKWAAFVGSSAAFVVLLYVLVVSLTRAASSLPPAAESLFRNLRDLTAFLWVVFPLLWLVSPHGTGVLTASDHYFLIALLDLSAKVGFDAVIAARLSSVESITGDASGSAEVTPA